MLGKNRRKKVRKSVFYIRKNIVTKKLGKETRDTFFQKHTNSATKKCWEKNRQKEFQKSVFLNKHEYRTKKLGGKKHAK